MIHPQAGPISLDEYDKARTLWACVYRRAPGNGWIDVTAAALDDRIDLLSIDLRIGPWEIYRGSDIKKNASA